MSQGTEIRGEVRPFVRCSVFPERTQAQSVVDHWNREHLIGELVICWPFGRQSAARITATRGSARVQEHAGLDGAQWLAQIYVDGLGGAIGLDRVALIRPGNLRGTLRIEVTSIVELNLDLAVPHRIESLQDAVGRAVAPLAAALRPES